MNEDLHDKIQQIRAAMQQSSERQLDALKHASPVMLRKDQSEEEEQEEQYLQGMKHAKVREANQRLDLREKLSDWAPFLIILWLASVMLTIWLSAVEMQVPVAYPACMPLVTKFDVSDSVLMALLGTTSINLIGLLYVMFKHVFPDGRN